MRLIAEERRSGTLESLMTAPITEAQVVLGESFRGLRLLRLPVAADRLLPADPLALQRGGLGPIAAGYLGVFCVGCTFLAIGIFGSSFTKTRSSPRWSPSSC